MKIKLDENLSRHLKAPLERFGHEIHTVADEGLIAHPDTEVASAAKNENRMLFTLDVGLADLRRFPPGTHPGILLFRPDTLGPLTVNEFIVAFVKHADLDTLSECLVVVESDRIRIRRAKSE